MEPSVYWMEWFVRERLAAMRAEAARDALLRGLPRRPGVVRAALGAMLIGAGRWIAGPALVARAVAPRPGGGPC